MIRGNLVGTEPPGGEARPPVTGRGARADRFVILGGRPLEGIARVGGAKNAALPMMAAAILADEPVRLLHVPRVADVTTLATILGELGLSVHREPEGALRLETVDTVPVRASYRHVRRMRAGFCVLGPLLARRRRAVVSLPGGCNIGPRPVDLHLKGLAALGAELSIRHGYVLARAGRLRGTTIDMAGPAGPTVTGTANVMCAAVLAEGTTTITSAPLEPEIAGLGRLLNRMGAKIEGLDTSTLHVRGVAQLGGTSERVISDRIEAATLLLAAAITRGSATVTGANAEHLEAVLAKLDAAGAHLATRDDRVSISAAGALKPVDVTATPYPGLPTDLQAQWTALMSLAAGRSRVSDRVFPQRFQHAAELNRLGARIRVAGGSAAICGPARLSGADVVASDLRASAALVLAGLAAGGRTVVHGIGHLDRGYEQLDVKLAGLGARIWASSAVCATRSD